MKNDLRIVNLSTYTSPTVKEVRNQEFVSYGDDNNYFQYLIDRYNGSPTNNAIINGISEMIYGKGLDATDSNKKPDQYAQMVSLFNADCVRKVVYDLKLMGQCAIQVIYSKDRTKIVSLEHIPVETLRAEKCNDKGEIEAYFYHYDWSKHKKSDEIKRIPAFGTSKEGLEIMYIKPYRAGFKYYSPVDYQGGTQYAELEEEISNYHLNNIMNGLAPSMLINFNNGTPDPEQRELIERRIYEKFSGSSNAGKFILAFNDNAETAADIQPIQLSEAHNTYQFLSDESARKILVSHRCVSPMLLGIKDNTGLGNNADELKTATILMDNTVIRPFQRLLIENFDQILAYNNISLNLYFKTLQPLEFTDLDNVADMETREEETGVKMSKEELSKDGLTDEMYDNIFDALKGEIVTGEWELVDERDYDKENVSEEEWVSNFVKEKENLYQVASQPSGFSYLDKSNYKVRYKYAVGSRKSGGKSRRFCSDMMAASKAGVVYRLEDIDRASRNLNFKAAELPMHNNQKFSLFEHKGGIYCRHIWKEVLYVLKKNKEKSEDISDYKKTKDIPKSYKPKPRGKKKSEIAPINTPTKGAYPS
jgi:hypothetical protein